MTEAWDVSEPFLYRTRVAEQDIDGLNHTNNAVYVRWCEAAAWEHSSALGLDVNSYQQLDRGMAVARAEYDYLQASSLGDEVQVATWIDSWAGKLGMLRKFQIRREGDGATLLRSQIRFVCIELSSGKPRRLPPEFIAAYGPAVRHP